MEKSIYQTPIEQVRIKEYKDRKGLKFSDNDIDEDVLNIAVMEYAQKYCQSVSFVGASDCYTIDFQLISVCPLVPYNSILFTISSRKTIA